MVNLPTSMPSVFNATYTPIAAAGTNTQVRHLARLLAAQLAVWANDENVTGSPNRALLGQLLGLTDVSIDNKVKKSHRVSAYSQGLVVAIDCDLCLPSAPTVKTSRNNR